MGEPALDGQVTFIAGETYWSDVVRHAIRSEYVAGIGRRRWNLKNGKGKNGPEFEVPTLSRGCLEPSLNPFIDWDQKTRRITATSVPAWFENSGCYARPGTSHEVPERWVYDFCINQLQMVPIEPPEPKIVEVLVEKVVEKVVETPWHMTAEQREVLAFALTRERMLTEEELRECYEYEDEPGIKAVSGRLVTIREMYEELGLPEVKGRPTWVLERRKPTELEQQELFDAM